MIKLKDIAEALKPTVPRSSKTASQHYQSTRQEAVKKLNKLRLDVETLRSPADPGSAGHDPKKEQSGIAAMKSFVIKVEALERDFDRLKAKIQ